MKAMEDGTSYGAGRFSLYPRDCFKRVRYDYYVYDNRPFS